MAVPSGERRPLRVPGLVLAISMGLCGAPAFARNGSCAFQAKGLALSFGTLDPSSGVTVTAPAAAATLNADQAGDCRRVTMVFSADNGLHFNGSRRMSNGTDTIPYSLTLPASQTAPGNNKYIRFVISGTVQPSAYQNASAGQYSDSVTITVTP